MTRMAPTERSLRRLYLSVALAATGVVAAAVSSRTIAVVEARGLLPRWDLATHLVHGWTDYHYLVSGRLDRLLADLWLQGYWPPMHSIFQVPYYLLLGGGMNAGLWSSLGAFILIGVVATGLLWRLWQRDAALPAAVFLALIMTSPYVLAYASVAMTEVLGALAQLVVLLAYVHFRQRPGRRTARWFAVSLTILFFTKYNYLVMLAGPLLLHEWLERTAGWNVTKRIAAVWEVTWRVLRTPTGALVALYLVGLAVIGFTGGFVIDVLGQRISIRSIGNSGYVVLYALLLRLWFLHHRGRVPWARLFAADPRLRPLVIWFGVPVTVWLASPYPNHLQDVFSLVVNRPMGEPTLLVGVSTYLDAMRHSYFHGEWLLALTVAVLVVAAAQYRRQAPVMQLLILAVPIQLTAIVTHQTRFSRFLLLPVVLLCLAAAVEVGRWVTGDRRFRLPAAAAAPAVLALGLMTSLSVMAEPRFRALAFEHYVESPALGAALASIRDGLDTDTRLAIVGRSNDLSPALFRWMLGPPSGVPQFPLEARDADLSAVADASRVLQIVPIDVRRASPEITSAYPAEARILQAWIDRGELVFDREIPVEDLSVALRLYDRTPGQARRR